MEHLLLEFDGRRTDLVSERPCFGPGYARRARPARRLLRDRGGPRQQDLCRLDRRARNRFRHLLREESGLPDVHGHRDDEPCRLARDRGRRNVGGSGRDGVVGRIIAHSERCVHNLPRAHRPLYMVQLERRRCNFPFDHRRHRRRDDHRLIHEAISEQRGPRSDGARAQRVSRLGAVHRDGLLLVG